MTSRAIEAMVSSSPTALRWHSRNSGARSWPQTWHAVWHLPESDKKKREETDARACRMHSSDFPRCLHAAPVACQAWGGVPIVLRMHARKVRRGMCCSALHTSASNERPMPRLRSSLRTTRYLTRARHFERDWASR